MLALSSANAPSDNFGRKMQTTQGSQILHSRILFSLTICFIAVMTYFHTFPVKLIIFEKSVVGFSF